MVDAAALALEAAGAFSLVLEGIPGELASRITAALEIPTIGIGAGPGCDGQVLVFHDLLGIQTELTPKFVKRYAELNDEMIRALSDYRKEVKSGEFPDLEHSYETRSPRGKSRDD